MNAFDADLAARADWNAERPSSDLPDAAAWDVVTPMVPADRAAFCERYGIPTEPPF